MKVIKSRIRSWVQALRSGKYKQSREALRRGNAYCCLGVACCVFRKITGRGRWRNDFFFSSEKKGGRGHGKVLPRAVANWFGLCNTNPMVGRYVATQLNDEQCKNFNQIANAIESTFLNPTPKERRKHEQSN